MRVHGERDVVAAYRLPFARRARLRGLIALAALALAAALAGACGDDEAKPSGATSTLTPSTVAAPTASSTPEPTEVGVAPTEAEIDWVKAVCGIDLRFNASYETLAGAGVNPATLTVEQRRARAEVFWPGLLGLNEKYVSDLAELAVPPRVVRLHAAYVASAEEDIAQLRRSLGEMDAIFASLEALEGNNLRLDNAQSSSQGVISDLFRTDPPILHLYETLPECLPLHATATPTPVTN